jgi:murein L,D-transpeptidase YcbB/YkuD
LALHSGRFAFVNLILCFTFLFLPRILFCPPLFAAPLENIHSALQKVFEESSRSAVPESDVASFPHYSPALVSDVYLDNNYSPIWVDASGPTRRADILYNVLKKSSEEGLNPTDYSLSSLDALWQSSDPSSLAHLDILLTCTLHSYVSDVREGRIDPCKKNPDLFACARDRNIPMADLVNQMVSIGNLTDFLGDQAPETIQYNDLKRALSRYRKIETDGGWPTIPDGPLLKTGAKSTQIPLIRERLIASGDMVLSDPLKNELYYDGALVSAVIRFQKRHGLTQDGIIGNSTRAALNIPVSTKIRRIIINMERLRWISRDLNERYVLVNIASFRLSVFDNSGFLFEMPVIVGSSYRKTPVFSEYIQYIDFNPYWNIPPFIAITDILPKLKADASYLSDRKIRVFDGWKTDAVELSNDGINWAEITPSEMGGLKLRQDPGPLNPLGQVKFMFPNRFAVYLHDSPSKDLFERTERTFSSGCIRVSEPVKLASYLLGGESGGFDEATIQGIIDKGDRKVVSLQAPVAAHIIYLTVCVGPDGLIYFNRDIYGRDKILEKALFED